MENHTARHFVLQLGSLIALYTSLSFLLVLFFGLINIMIPDAADSVWQLESASSSVRIGIAMVVVFFPTYLILTRIVNNSRRKTPTGTYLGLTKWLIYLSLLVSGLALLGDLVAVIMAFLEGDITTRFALKAFAVFVVIGSAFYYYIQDSRGYWITHERASQLYALIASLFVVAILAMGFTHIAPPTEVREMKIDNQMLADLQDMQWRIEDYYRSNESLPDSLAKLYGEFSVPTPPEVQGEYEYIVTSAASYSLCTTFLHNMTSANTHQTVDKVTIAPSYRGNNNWDYRAGYWCFERVIDGEYRQ